MQRHMLAAVRATHDRVTMSPRPAFSSLVVTIRPHLQDRIQGDSHNTGPPTRPDWPLCPWHRPVAGISSEWWWDGSLGWSAQRGPGAEPLVRGRNVGGGDVSPYNRRPWHRRPRPHREIKKYNHRRIYDTFRMAPLNCC